MLNLFKELTITKNCESCNKFEEHTVLANLQAAPNFLAIQVNAVDETEVFAAMIINEVSFKSYDGTYVRYEFYAAVLGSGEGAGAKYQAIVKD